ncbi:PEP-CTERM sorting domain-containing protein [Massilia arenosa]|uniref:PEP-CTERM sorting domain-containing protein n=1 Tax=Zemynaea arenosa TaxID=2561931 RepID=A0A4Y9SEK5_9BURK|nr:PEP-CTERM sorting domain-containing protein [Massilia arenosa]TFW19434.1 PEP-CTERM sorting domain-containing protein [Massilia arenosa]
MKLNKIASVLAGAALAVGAAAPASAITLTAGDLKITINAFDAGTTGYTGAGVVCNTVATCDTNATNHAARSFGSEDTWGIFSVQSISRVSDGGLIFTAGQGGQYLTGVFGGISDTRVSVIAGDEENVVTAYGTGGWLNMYYNSANYNSALGPTGRDLVDPTKYTGITGGTLALSAVFSPEVSGSATLNGYSYRSQFGDVTLAGVGQGFLDVTGGSLAAQLNTNSEFDPKGGAHDMFLKVTYAPSAQSAAAGWTVDATGDVQANALPEPASIAVFGLGLAGIAGLRRRKSK